LYLIKGLYPFSIFKGLNEIDMSNSKNPGGLSEFIIFKTEDEKISVDVRLEDETVWLT
jgi:hypothetical protein